MRPNIKAPDVVHSPVSNVPVPQVPAGTALMGTVLDEQAAAIREAANRERASSLESAKAAFSQSSLGDAYRLVTKPDYAPDVNTAWMPAFLAKVPFVMTTADREFIQKQTSREAAPWAVEQIQGQKQAHQAMGDHPVLAFAITAADLGYIGVGLVAVLILIVLKRRKSVKSKGLGSH